MPTKLRWQDSDLPYFSQTGFESPQIVHRFFGRPGGVSAGVYESLNCGPGSNDDRGAVLKNREIVCETLGILADNLVTLHQVHGDACLHVKEPWPLDQRPQADAMVTAVPGLALGILTADCAPVLFYGEGKGGPVIGAAHAGWGGALKGILESTIKEMRDLSAENIRACIGPCIARKSYEVSQEFYDRFIKESDESERFFAPGKRAGHFLFDLSGYCAARLHRAGLQTVSLPDRDTYAEEGVFFSYRRSVHRGESDYGRQISVIMIK